MLCAQVSSQFALPFMRDSLRTFAEERWKIALNRDFFRGFLKRHRKELSIRTSKALKVASALGDSPDQLNNFLDSLEARRDLISFSQSCVLNLDETRLLDEGLASGTMRIVSSGLSKVSHKVASDPFFGTLVPVVAADGSVLFSVYVVRSDVLGSGLVSSNAVLVPRKHCMRGDWARYVIYNASGNVSGEEWREIMRLIRELKKVRQPLTDILVFFDQYPAHLDSDEALKLLEDGIHAYPLPRNTTHFMQPLDDLVFANFQRERKRLVDKAREKNARYGRRSARFVLNTAYQAEGTALTVDIIKKAFERVGLERFNRGLIESRWEHHAAP